MTVTTMMCKKTGVVAFLITVTVGTNHAKCMCFFYLEDHAVSRLVIFITSVWHMKVQWVGISQRARCDVL